MQVILLDKIARLGGLGDQVTVKSGYARNFLLPQGKAVLATKDNVATFETRRAELEGKLAEQLAAAQARADQLSGLENVVIASKSGDEGKLFGSVGTQQIAEAAEQQGLEVERQEILMPNGTIRELGEYEVDLQLYGDIAAQVLVRVVVSE